MNFSRFQTILMGAVLLLPACSFTEEALWPTLSGDDPAGARAPQPRVQPQPAPRQKAARPATAVLAAPQPALGKSSFEPTGVTSGTATGTFVGKKVIKLREELKRLQAALSQHNSMLQDLRVKLVQDSQRYHGTVAAINARLQVGTTPGNPILVQQFNSAQSELGNLSADIGGMNRLATAVSSDSTLSAYLSESAAASFLLSGAVDEDHRQLAILEDEVNRSVVLVDRLLKEVADDVRRQTAYVATERGNLNLLSAGVKSGEIYGDSLVNRAMASAASVSSGGRTAQSSDISGRRPLVVIRFDKSNVNYQKAVYNAVSHVLERRPNATFDLVSVVPTAGGTATVAMNSTKARRSAEGVLRSLVEMGLPPSRVTVSANTSLSARGNEVHIYLR